MPEMPEMYITTSPSKAAAAHPPHVRKRFRLETRIIRAMSRAMMRSLHSGEREKNNPSSTPVQDLIAPP